MGSKFDSAARSLLEWEQGIDVSIDPRAVVPERALVFELIGPVADFEDAAQAFGLEWLISDRKRSDSSDADLEDGADDGDGGEDSTGGSRHVLYLTMPSTSGLRRLFSMWERYKKNEAPSDAEKPFWGVFGYLDDLRLWSAKDRIDPSVVKFIEAFLLRYPDRPVKVELDFWYRSERQSRDGAISTLRTFLDQVQGELLDLVEISEIKYQGALISIPAHIARELAQKQGSLAQLHEVMTIRPQAEFSSEVETGESDLDRIPLREAPTRRCITAILDGYPITAHTALEGHVHVHEVDIASSDVPAEMREHGTAMASLVVNGDLRSLTPSSLTRPVVVVPVLTNSTTGKETTPANKLAIGVIRRALDRILNNPAADGNLDDIAIINHSLCDTNSPFVRRPSPWAALLDYYSHHHRLLFVVSAGNITGSFPINYPDFAAFESDVIEREANVLLAIESAKGSRGILSPAESVNNLTIGALHADTENNAPQYVIDPYPNVRMTNLASAVGFGVNRSIKPDLVEIGGRFAAQGSNHKDGHVEIHAATAVDMGLEVAVPSPIGDLTSTRRTAGTSNAAALTTRACNQVADAIEDLFGADNVDWLGLPTRVPLLKTLIAHGCGWGDIGGILEESFPPAGSHSWFRRRDAIARFLGFGKPNFGRILDGAENRITLIAEDRIQGEDLHRYKIPMPSALFNTRDLRSITITLSWTTPIVTTTADYRGVMLKMVNSTGKKAFWKGVDKSSIYQPNGATAERGTLTQLRLEGSKQIKDVLQEGMFVGVQARAIHPSQEKAQVPYALAITLEMAQSQKTNLYVDVSNEIRARSGVRATTRVTR